MNAESLFLGNVSNGQSATQDLLLGVFQFQATLAGTSTVALGPVSGLLFPFRDYRVYVVGSASTGSLTLILQILPIPR